MKSHAKAFMINDNSVSLIPLLFTFPYNNFMKCYKNIIKTDNVVFLFQCWLFKLSSHTGVCMIRWFLSILLTDIFTHIFETFLNTF